MLKENNNLEILIVVTLKDGKKIQPMKKPKKPKN